MEAEEESLAKRLKVTLEPYYGKKTLRYVDGRKEEISEPTEARKFYNHLFSEEKARAVHFESRLKEETQAIESKRTLHKKQRDYDPEPEKHLRSTLDELQQLNVLMFGINEESIGCMRLSNPPEIPKDEEYILKKRLQQYTVVSGMLKKSVAVLESRQKDSAKDLVDLQKLVECWSVSGDRTLLINGPHPVDKEKSHQVDPFYSMQIYFKKKIELHILSFFKPTYLRIKLVNSETDRKVCRRFPSLSHITDPSHPLAAVFHAIIKVAMSQYNENIFSLIFMNASNASNASETTKIVPVSPTLSTISHQGELMFQIELCRDSNFDLDGDNTETLNETDYKSFEYLLLLLVYRLCRHNQHPFISQPNLNQSISKEVMSKQSQAVTQMSIAVRVQMMHKKVFSILSSICRAFPAFRFKLAPLASLDSVFTLTHENSFCGQLKITKNGVELQSTVHTRTQTIEDTTDLPFNITRIILHEILAHIQRRSKSIPATCAWTPDGLGIVIDSTKTLSFSPGSCLTDDALCVQVTGAIDRKVGSKPPQVTEFVLGKVVQRAAERKVSLGDYLSYVLLWNCPLPLH